MRRALGIQPGDTVLVHLNDGELRVRSMFKALERARAIVRRHVPEEAVLSDELIADRRGEARQSVNKAVLDASALLCLLHDERGADRVAEVLDRAVVGAHGRARHRQSRW